MATISARGAMAAHSPVMREVVTRARAGTPVLGICNGFQVLTEAGLLPGVLMRNATLKFICKDVHLRVERNDTAYTRRYAKGEVVRFPIAHKDGSYFADEATLERLEGEGRVAFRYCDEHGEVIGRRQSQRLAPQHRRHLQRDRDRARADAAP